MRACRGITPPKLVAGHYAAVYNDELWVFPGPKNHTMRSVHCCELQRYRWQEREVRGDPPALPEARRNLDCFLDGNKLIVFGEIPQLACSMRAFWMYGQTQGAALP